MNVWDRHPWLLVLAVTLLALLALVSSQLEAGGSSAVVYQSF
jgi:hypothetical protein